MEISSQLSHYVDHIIYLHRYTVIYSAFYLEKHVMREKAFFVSTQD